MEAIAITAAIFQAVGAIQQGISQSNAYKAQAQAQEASAKIAQMNADIARQQGNANEEAQRRRSAQIIGAQRAGIAEAGIGMDGSGADLLEQSAGFAELDALNIRYNSQLQSNAFMNQSSMDLWQAQQSRKRASDAMTSGYLNAGASALNGYGGYLKNGLQK